MVQGASCHAPVATSMITGCASGIVLLGGHCTTVAGVETIDLPSGDHWNAAPSPTGVGPIDRVAPPLTETTPIGSTSHWPATLLLFHRLNAIVAPSGENWRSVSYR